MSLLLKRSSFSLGASTCSWLLLLAMARVHSPEANTLSAPPVCISAIPPSDLIFLISSLLALLQVLVERLQAAAAQAESESDALYKRFQEGQLGVEAFVEQYTAARAVYHQRDLKAQAAVHTIPMLDP